MIDDRFVWLAGASAFLLPWVMIYLGFPVYRRAMLLASAFTALFGLTEPLFVPEYWAPPSLFDFALRTGFDIESLIFWFGIGGMAAVAYDKLSGARPGSMIAERFAPPYRDLYALIAAPLLIFSVLYVISVNPIYAGIVAMIAGAAVAVFLRPDLRYRTWIGGIVFYLYYAAFTLGLEWVAPGYIGRIWNLDALSGILVGPVPIEGLAFAFAFGMYWSGVYEHLTCQSRSVPANGTAR